MKKFLFFFLFLFSLFSASVTLYNDSNFPLIAKVYDAEGILRLVEPLKPYASYNWTVGEDPFTTQPMATYTPLTVVWVCDTKDRPFDYNPPPKSKEKSHDKNEPPKYETSFGVWTGVGPGATVNAMGSPTGPKTCISKKEKQHETEKEKNKTEQKRHEENWENDGSNQWSNDSSDPFNQFKGN